MAEHRIVATPGTCSGQPRIAGTRITVARVAKYFMGGTSAAHVAVAYGLHISDVEEAIRYRMRANRMRKRGGR